MSLRSRVSSLSLLLPGGLLLAALAFLPACRGEEEAAEAVPAASGETAPARPAIPAGDERRREAFLPLELPRGILYDRPEKAGEWPWILVADDPQCPYCVQLGLGLRKAREAGDSEISRAVEAIVLFPLSFHDQAAHASADVVCFEQTREGRPWDGISYLRHLMTAPYTTDPAWPGLGVDDLWKPGGWFTTAYPERKMTASTRRAFLLEVVRRQEACDQLACGTDADCLALCDARAACLSDCSAAGSGQEASCAQGCRDEFVRLRFRQLSAVIQNCLLRRDGHDPHALVSGTEAWCRSQGIPGTPTILVGHPEVGFKLLGDSDELTAALERIGAALAEARALLEAS